MRNFKIDRRRFLRGAGLAGIAIALPPLDAMLDSRGRFHGSAVAQPTPAPSRMVLFHFPNGTFLRDWTPSADGMGLAVPPAMKSFLDLTSDVNVVSGLSNLAATDLSSGKDDHQRAGSTILTSVPATPAGAGGISVDQLAAQHIGGATRFESLVVYASSENSVHHSRMSWRGLNDPVEPIEDPAALFNQLFSSGMDDAAAMRLEAERRSILDYVKEDANDLHRMLGMDDRARLQQHMDSIADLERAIQGGLPAACSAVQDPGAFPSRRDPSFMSTFERRVDTLLELVRLALVCDLTRVVSFSLGSTNNTNLYSFLGLQVDDHGTSHYGIPGGGGNDSSSPVTHRNYQTMSEWKISRAANFLRALRDTTDGTASLLDNTAFACFSEMSNGDWHSTMNLPVIVAGKLGSMVTGQHKVYPCDEGSWPRGVPSNDGLCGTSGNTSIASLWLSMLHAVGAPVTGFGDATQTLPGLWV